MTNYLPRINTILNDQGLKIAPPPVGPKVTLMGVTSNPTIPVLEPFTVTSVEKAINSLYFNFSGLSAAGFPDNNVPGELSLAIEEAVNGGAPNIEVIVIGRYSGQALLDYISPVATQYARYNDLSGAYDVLKNRDVDVVIPVGAHMDDNIYSVLGGTGLSLNFGKQLADFCFQATTQENACVGVIGTRPIMSWAMRHAPTPGTGTPYVYYDGYTGNGLRSDATINTELTALFPAVFLTGGTSSPNAAIRSGMAAVEYATPSARLLKEWHAYHAYSNDTAAFVSDVDRAPFYNNIYLNWLSGAADQNGNTLSDINEDTATAVAASYFANWQAKDSDGTNAVDSRNGKVDAGSYISVFSTPLRASGTQISDRALTLGAGVSNTTRNTDGAAAYGGLITSLAPQSSTTNKRIDGVVQLRPLSAPQANDLVGMRHVTMYTRPTGLTVASGVTGAHNVSKYIRSDYVRLSTVRIVHSVVDLIRGAASKYIGEPNNAPQMNALDAEIDQLLLSVKTSGGLNAYAFSISSTPDQRVLGELDINLTLVPAFEITTINLVVSLAKEL